jgi:hypothetical protein
MHIMCGRNRARDAYYGETMDTAQLQSFIQRVCARHQSETEAFQPYYLRLRVGARLSALNQSWRLDIRSEDDNNYSSIMSEVMQAHADIKDAGHRKGKLQALLPGGERVEPDMSLAFNIPPPDDDDDNSPSLRDASGIMAGKLTQLAERILTAHDTAELRAAQERHELRRENGELRNQIVDLEKQLIVFEVVDRIGSDNSTNQVLMEVFGPLVPLIAAKLAKSSTPAPRIAPNNAAPYETPDVVDTVLLRLSATIDKRPEWITAERAGVIFSWANSIPDNIIAAALSS